VEEVKERSRTTPRFLDSWKDGVTQESVDRKTRGVKPEL